MTAEMIMRNAEGGMRNGKPKTFFDFAFDFAADFLKHPSKPKMNPFLVRMNPFLIRMNPFSPQMNQFLVGMS
jgi:hypothetical protein